MQDRVRRRARPVAEVEEDGIVRVVRRPDRIEPELLHEHDVRAHRLDRDDPTGVLVEVVAIDAADVDTLPVDEEVEPANLDASEPDLDGRLLGEGTGRVAQDDRQRVAVRLLGGPRGDPGQATGVHHHGAKRAGRGVAGRRWPVRSHGGIGPAP